MRLTGWSEGSQGQPWPVLRSRGLRCLSLAVLQLLLCQAAQPAGDASSSSPSPRKACEKPPLFDVGRLHRARCPLLPKVCFDQGSYIIYDQSIIQGSPAGELLPAVKNFQDAQWELPYFHRHHDINPQGSSTPEMTVNGVSMPYFRVGGGWWAGGRAVIVIFRLITHTHAHTHTIRGVVSKVLCMKKT